MFAGKRLVAVVGHTTPHANIDSHWVAWLDVNGVWHRVDSSRPTPNQENPFTVQIGGGGNNETTLDLFFFK